MQANFPAIDWRIVHDPPSLPWHKQYRPTELSDFNHFNDLHCRSPLIFNLGKAKKNYLVSTLNNL